MKPETLLALLEIAGLLTITGLAFIAALGLVQFIVFLCQL